MTTTDPAVGAGPFDQPDGEDFSVGVEEEFFLVDAETSNLRPDATEVLEAAHLPAGSALGGELKRSQVETGSSVCRDLSELRASIIGLRRSLGEAAAGIGARLASVGTHPFASLSDDGGVTRDAAYQDLDSTYRLLADEQTVCGCHVHVGVRDRELAIDVMNRVRAWVPVLVALGTNSPFWLGLDTGYASYRTQIFHRWPTTGIPEHFADLDEYQRTVEQLAAVEAIDSPARIYWDVRPSARYPTLEFRAADAFLTVDEVVAFAALVRALVQRSHGEAVAGVDHVVPRPELLRAALWRSSRFGLSAQLLDPVHIRLRPAPEVLGLLIDHVRSILEERGELEQVVSTMGFVVRQGTGAVRQRAACSSAGGDLRAVLPMVTTATMASR